jgi:hypothetical protein
MFFDSCWCAVGFEYARAGVRRKLEQEGAGERSSGSLDPRSAVLCARPPRWPTLGFISRAIPKIVFHSYIHATQRV